MAKVTLDGEAQKERIVCVETSAVRDGGEPMYDEAATRCRNGARWKN